MLFRMITWFIYNSQKLT